MELIKKISFLLKWTAIFVICAAFGIFTGSYVIYRSGIPDVYDSWLCFHQIGTLLFSLLFFSLAISIHWYCIKQHKDIRGYFRKTLTACLLAYIFILMHDEKLINNTYTWHDAVLPSEKNLDSYKIITENFMYDHQKINVDLSDIDKNRTNG